MITDSMIRFDEQESQEVPADYTAEDNDFYFQCALTDYENGLRYDEDKVQ